MNVLAEKLKEVVFSVLPVVILITLINIAVVHVDTNIFIRFLLSSVFVILGLAIFLFGIEQGISPIGSELGSAITLKNKISLVIIGGIVLGFLISIAEPDLHILSIQVQNITSGAVSKLLLIYIVSIGVALFVAFGLLRIVFRVKQKTVFSISYGLIFILAIFAGKAYIAISFDSSGATTGAITVPFILALAVGVSRMKKDSLASERDSFGLVGMASAGAILSVLVLGIFKPVEELTGDNFALNMNFSTEIIATFIKTFPAIIKDSVFSLLPLTIIFLVANITFIKLKKSQLVRIIKGLIITFIGLTIFMLGVHAGFLDIGFIIGNTVGNLSHPIILFLGFLIGLVIILAEPAVYVLTKQIEHITGGSVPRRLVLMFLALGVSLAVMLSMARIIVKPFQLWHILLPGYIVAITLALFTPDLFVGMAFDAGGVASGPMTATFVLSFAQGVANAVPTANILIDGFGIIATVALAPILSLEILGLMYNIKQKKHHEVEEKIAMKNMYSLLIILVPYGKARKVVKYARKHGSKGSTVILASGTVKGKLLEFLGISKTGKEMILTAGSDTDITKLMNALNKKFHISSKQGFGIVFTLPLEYLLTSKIKTPLELEYFSQGDNMQEEKSAIFTIVNRGKANEVVEVSLEAGAHGGTIINGRGSGTNQTKHIFDIDIEPEKEIVMTIVDKKQVDTVVQAIRKKSNVEKDGHGILFVVPVTKAFGIKSDLENK